MNLCNLTNVRFQLLYKIQPAIRAAARATATPSTPLLPCAGRHGGGRRLSRHPHLFDRRLSRRRDSNPGLSARLRWLRVRVPAAADWLLLLIYPSLCRTTLSTFRCTELPCDAASPGDCSEQRGEFYLHPDPAAKCSCAAAPACTAEPRLGARDLGVKLSSQRPLPGR